MSGSPAVRMSPSEAAHLLDATRVGSAEVLGVLDGAPLLEVDLDAANDELVGRAPPPWLPCVVVGYAASALHRAPLGVDLAVTEGVAEDAPPGWITVADLSAERSSIAQTVATTPQSAVTLAQVLRTSEQLDVDSALVTESLAYSTLQSGAAFSSWLATRPPPRASEDGEQVVLVARDRDVLQLTLNRPHVRNAVSSRMRDELCEALAVACADPSIAQVTLRGAGPAFCSGGDLDEFGTLPDPVTGHLTRTTRSPAHLLAQLAPRLVAHVHGACVGAGIEFAAFAARIVAEPDARFSLPELELGLIPGAGGTVSIPRRIGRQRTMGMGLGSAVDATTALHWGLVDDLAPTT